MLQGTGKVAIDFGPDRRVEAIGEKGQSHFPSVPAEFQGKEVSVSLQAEGFERTDTGQLKLTGESLYLAVRKRAQVLRGKVMDTSGAPITDALITIETLTKGISTRSETSGRFSVDVPGDQVHEDMPTFIRATGFMEHSEPATPGGNPLIVRLKARP